MTETTIDEELTSTGPMIGSGVDRIFVALAIGCRRKQKLDPKRRDPRAVDLQDRRALVGRMAFGLDAVPADEVRR